MIHTMLLSSSINAELYREIANELGIDLINNQYMTRNYSRLGFREIILIRTERKDMNPYHGIEIVLNPNVLIHEREVIAPISYDDVSRIADAFDHTIRLIMRLSNIYEKLLTFNNWTCKRIDYCVDIRIPNAVQYMELIYKSDKPSEHYLQYTSNSKRGKLDIQSESVSISSHAIDEDIDIQSDFSNESPNTIRDSFYYYSNSVTLNFYNKGAEVRNRQYEEYSIITPELIEEAEGIIRFEVQCSGIKLTKIKNTYGLENKNIEHYLRLEIAKSIILWYYDHTIGRQDYFSLKAAKKEVKKQNDLKLRFKGVLCDILNLNAQARKIPSARKQYIRKEGVYIKGIQKTIKGSFRTYNRNNDRLRDFGINPVTIPKRWNINKMDNLINLILHALED